MSLLTSKSKSNSIIAARCSGISTSTSHLHISEEGLAMVCLLNTFFHYIFRILTKYSVRFRVLLSIVCILVQWVWNSVTSVTRAGSPPVLVRANKRGREGQYFTRTNKKGDCAKLLISRDTCKFTSFPIMTSFTISEKVQDKLSQNCSEKSYFNK